MLSTPESGWSDITLPGWSDRCSYIDDVPIDLLEAFLRLFTEKRMQAVEFDAEGWDYIIVIGTYETYVIEEDGDITDEAQNKSDDSPSVHRIEKNAAVLASELVSDIREDIDAWTDWMSYREITVEERRERKERLLSLCEQLEKYIQKDKSRGK